MGLATAGSDAMVRENLKKKMTMRRMGLPLFCITAVVTALFAPPVYAQDERNVTEPRIPQSCVTLTASPGGAGSNQHKL